MTDESRRLFDERLEEFRRHLRSAIDLERVRLDESLRRHTESLIAEISARMEESIRNAVAEYERAMAKANAYDGNPELAILAESVRNSAQRMMDTTISFHRQIAEQGIRSIQGVMREHQARSRKLKF